MTIETKKLALRDAGEFQIEVPSMVMKGERLTARGAAFLNEQLYRLAVSNTQAYIRHHKEQYPAKVWTNVEIQDLINTNLAHAAGKIR